MPIFSSFQSTVTPLHSRRVNKDWNLLSDPVTGAPAGIQSPNGSGPDGIWTPIDLTADQIATPTALMLADLNATYRLNVAPYTRYWSNGSVLVGLNGVENGLQVVPFGTTQVIWSPWTVTSVNPTSVQGTVIVRTLVA